MNLFRKTGKIALSRCLRLLNSQITEDASLVYKLYDIGFSPKWFPIFYILAEESEKTITEISQEAGHSQPSVTKEEWEFLLEKKSLLRRVLEYKKERESLKVQIVSYESKYQKAFKDLNEE